MKNKKLFWGTMTILWVIVIFSFSLQPGEVSGDFSGSFLQKLLGWFIKSETISQDQLDILHTVLRKCAHFTEFAVLGVLSSLTMMQTKVKHRFLLEVCFGLVVASLDETLQLFVDGRAGRVTDVLIDGAGAVVGISMVKIICKQIKGRDCHL